MERKTPVAVVDTTKEPKPIVIKIELPKDAEKQNNADHDEAKKPSKSRFCQLLPVVLFLVTFATVLSLLVTYMNPSSE